LTHEQRDHAADDVRERRRRMLEECDSAGDAVQEARNTAAHLKGLVAESLITDTTIAFHVDRSLRRAEQ
jgi:hypothetical protein